MNLIARQIYGNKLGGVPNTFIGGMASTIYTPALLASKLAIDMSRISVFSIVGSDIKCRITGSYAIPDGASTFGFQSGYSNTYYTDADYLVSAVGNNSFYAQDLNVSNYGDIDFKNCLSVGASGLQRTVSNKILLRNATTIGAGGLASCAKCLCYYIPVAINLGTGVTDASVFTGILSGAIIYAHPSMATCNSGGVHASLAAAITAGAVVRYVSSFVAPNSVTDLSIGNVYSTAIQVLFTAPTGSTNAIYFYEVWLNGTRTDKTVTASGQFVTGLATNTSYIVELKPVDIFYNKSGSNVPLPKLTATPSYIDSDANASIAAKSLTGIEQESEYALIVESKNQSLWPKIQAVYTFKGTTAAQHKFNAKNPLDTDAAFRLTFIGTGTFSNSGYLTNGTGSYANTHLVPSAVQNVNSNGMTIVVGTNDVTSSGNDFIMGAYQTATQCSLLADKNNNSTYLKKVRINGSEVSVANGNTPLGSLTGVRVSSTVTKMFKNSVLLGSANSGGTLPSINLWIGDNDSNGSSYSNIKRRVQMAIIHEGLSDAEVSTLHSIIDLSESIAGRKTW